MTTTTFADYAAQQDARNTIQLNVTKWTLMLCDALKQNFIDYSIKSHQSFLERLKDISDAEESYHLTCIQDLKNGNCGYDFTIETGRKYHKVIMHTENQRSAHAFVDKKTGEVYKSASWKSPAKGVRYDLRLIEDREWLFENADWAAGYLYK
jgi:hypothetical protein